MRGWSGFHRVAPASGCLRRHVTGTSPVTVEWLEMQHFGHAGVVWVSLGALARGAGVVWVSQGPRLCQVACAVMKPGPPLPRQNGAKCSILGVRGWSGFHRACPYVGSLAPSCNRTHPCLGGMARNAAVCGCGGGLGFTGGAGAACRGGLGFTSSSPAPASGLRHHAKQCDTSPC